MNNTILSEKDTQLIEKVILEYGKIVTINNLMAVFSTEYSDMAAHNRIQKLADNGWFKRIKRGTYLVIENISSRYQNDHSLLLISNALNEQSYVSLSYALNYYNLFDQYSKVVVAVTMGEPKRYSFDDHVFKYAKVKKSMYFGFSQKTESGGSINIADVEKALIDTLYLDKSFTSASLIYEKLRDHQDSIDFRKLVDYALKIDMALKRKFGFLLDHLNIETNDLYKSLGENRGYSKFTSDSRQFNAKWRIYYDERITR